MKKEETSITLANGGMHSQVNYKKAKDMLLNHDYAMPRLYHLVFTGSEDIERYQDSINALTEKLRDNKIPCKWKSAIERDDEKRLHMHVMLLVDAKHGRPDYYIRYHKDGWLVNDLKKRGVDFHIAPPKSLIHRTGLGKIQNFAYLAKGEKLEDCLIWISYLYKNRSKDPGIRNPYGGSRERKKSQPNQSPVKTSLPSSNLVPIEPPKKTISNLAHKLLDRYYELGHNNITIFRASQEFRT